MNTATEHRNTGSNTVGELIRRYRLKAGRTQEELGEKTELSVRVSSGRRGSPRRRTPLR
jgi:hypothetical protein